MRHTDVTELDSYRPVCRVGDWRGGGRRWGQLFPAAFAIVDRGAAAEALQRERELAARGELREGSDMGGGQLVAADCLVTPNVLFQDPDAGGSNVGGILGGLLPGMLGAVAGGSASKRDIGFNVGALLIGGGVGAAGGGGSYASTDIGKIVIVAFVDGLNKLVAQIG